jgi:hypothetical protein
MAQASSFDEYEALLKQYRCVRTPFAGYEQPKSLPQSLNYLDVKELFDIVAKCRVELRLQLHALKTVNIAQKVVTRYQFGQLWNMYRALQTLSFRCEGQYLALLRNHYDSPRYINSSAANDRNQVA